MSTFGGIYFTNKGKALQAKAQAGAQLNFTRLAVGDGSLGGQAIEDLSALVHEVKSLDINTMKTMPGGKASVWGILSNQGIAAGFYWRELGLFARDPDLGEILYCYGNAGALAEYIPAPGGADILEKQISIVTIVGNAANVSATIEQSLVYATAQELQVVQNEVAAHKAENMLHAAGGTANAIEVTTGGDFQYTQGNPIRFKATANSTGAVTINVDGKGAKAGKKPDGSTVNNLKQNKVYSWYFDTTGDCFFLVASAEGSAIADKVLAGYTFSNDEDVGILGTLEAYEVGKFISTMDVQGPFIAEVSTVDIGSVITQFLFSDIVNDCYYVRSNITIYKYKISSGELIGTLSIPSSSAIDFTYDGYILVYSSANQTLYKYDLNTMTPIWQKVYNDYYANLTIGADGQYFYYSTSAKYVKKCSMVDGTLISTINNFVSSSVVQLVLKRDVAITIEGSATYSLECYGMSLATLTGKRSIGMTIYLQHSSFSYGCSASLAGKDYICVTTSQSQYSTDTIHGQFTSFWEQRDYILKTDATYIANHAGYGYSVAEYGLDQENFGTQGTIYASAGNILVFTGISNGVLIDGTSTIHTISTAGITFSWTLLNRMGCVTYNNNGYLLMILISPTPNPYCLFKLDTDGIFKPFGVVQNFNNNEINPDNPYSLPPYCSDGKYIYFRSSTTGRIITAVSMPSYKILR